MFSIFLTDAILFACNHSPELYRSCSWLLKKKILLPFISNPFVDMQLPSWWSLCIPFSTLFMCSLFCFPLHLISMSDLLLDHFHWKCWGQQRRSMWSMTEKNLSQKSTPIYFMRFGCWKLCSFLWILRYKTPQYVQSSDKQHFNPAVIHHSWFPADICKHQCF